ncbi:hypothetical protein [Polaribacter cellanae]|uniref:Uncharacterized protein n=1 Tax=Polaribacter cellanae TaxID=2818493 RepID=A0A975CQM8_9FLAO|nr:hypothetical protein [Polaribacter cellanae]QTE23560.1 hypothetical protein J3359_04555 [Polaribacter cellanae]
MKQLNLITVLAIFLLSLSNVNGQSKVIKLNFKKGEVLDILLFTGKPDMGKYFPEYKKTAFAFALQTGYTPQPILNITETTEGGLQPGNFVFGKWKNLTAREQFLNEIDKKVPDFHQQRRKMWSTFYLSYFEMNENTSFELHSEKLNVATAYWLKNKNDIKNFQKEWTKMAKKNGATILLGLNNPKSSVGYMYKPNFIILTSWPSKASFDNFKKEAFLKKNKSVINVNEFIIK